MGDYLFPVVGPYTITSGIGSRSSPGGIGSTNHQGVDIAAKSGAAIVAPTDITIIKAGSMGGYGNTVIGQDSFGNQHLFGHLQTIGVEQGQTLGAGSYLGAMGSTGNSTGTHLHYAIRDSAGKFLADKTKQVLSKAKQVANKALGNAINKGASAALNTVLPGSGLVLDSIGGIPGIGGESCNWFCQFKNWITESQFLQRLGIVALAIVLIFAAFYLFGTGQVQKMVSNVKG